MKFIWAFIIMLTGFYIYYFINFGGISTNLAKIPVSIIDLSWKNGLWSFLIGIAIMNIPTHISNMSIWQRISGVEEEKAMISGLRKSIWGAGFSWGFLIVLACLSFTIVVPIENENLLTTVIKFLNVSYIGKFVLFFIVLGLYGAMLSTASTNLIVVAHTIYEDIYSRFKKTLLKERINSSKELKISRYILIFFAILTIFIVEGLKWIGFSIADLVFAIYGGQLALFPAILTALYSKPKQYGLGKWATLGIILGFLLGWSAAIAGKIFNLPDLIFLAPCISIVTASVFILFGFILSKKTVV